MLAVADAGTPERTDRDRVTITRELVDQALTIAQRVYAVVPPDHPPASALSKYALSMGAQATTSHALAAMMVAGRYPRNTVVIVAQSERPEYRMPPAYLTALARFVPNAVIVLESSSGRAAEILSVVPGSVAADLPVYSTRPRVRIQGRDLAEALRLADRARAPALNF